MRDDLDLTKHLLWVGFKNRYIDPKNPETVQSVIARLMTEYPHIFPNSMKISYAIHQLKNQGLVVTIPHIDTKELAKCIEQAKQEHPRLAEKKIRQECKKKLGYTEVLQITDTGVVLYCDSVKPYLKYPTTKTNRIVLEVCKQYQPQPEF